MKLAISRLTISMLLIGSSVIASELVRVTPDTWDEFVPAGKEVDCIYGDVVIRNDQLTLVIATPAPNRNANMSVRGVGGCIIDLTRREHPNDQLGAYFPGGGKYVFTNPDLVRVAASGSPLERLGPSARIQARSVTYECETTIPIRLLKVRNRYKLSDGDPFVTVETIYENTSADPLDEELVDAIRADRTFEFGNDGSTNMYWANDDWFRQAYGIVVDDRTIVNDKILQLRKGESNVVKIEPRSQWTVSRRIFPAQHLMQLKGIASQLLAQPVAPYQIQVVDPGGAVSNAKVTVSLGEKVLGSGRTDSAGVMMFHGAPVELTAMVEAQGRPSVTVTLPTNKGAVNQSTVTMAACGYVKGKITNLAGEPIPCKIAFRPKESGSDWPRDKDGKFDAKQLVPNFGPETSDVGVLNLVYAAQGTFRREIAPGAYEVLISHGPEYDLVTKDIVVSAGADTQIAAQLVRSVNSPGWVSTDFHSHSSPSGDNTSSQVGRVLNHVCENIEFAPCTEHNRIDSYVPHLKSLGVEGKMGTCSGIELTGAPLPLNHQNAFPLRQVPRTQDGGGPTTDANPEEQIKRLAMWDNQSEKLVQCNHPNIVQMFGDRDLDGTPDSGFRSMLATMDVMEVHPLHYLFSPPANAKPGERRIHHWLQLLNLGYRVPGVVNSDAHYNFHGSGWMRNYVRCSTDDPAKIETMEIVRASEAGKIVMSTGPFMEVALANSTDQSKFFGPGEDANIPGGGIAIHVRVQCPNWFDVNRVQVLVNGKPLPELNFTRRDHPDRFGSEVVKFDSIIQTTLSADAHVIVATIGDGLKLSRVMGPTFGEYAPIAVSNPIFVDVDGNGFVTSRDPLEDPLPMETK